MLLLCPGPLWVSVQSLALWWGAPEAATPVLFGPCQEEAPKPYPSPAQPQPWPCDRARWQESHT